MKQNAGIWSLLILLSIGFFIPSNSYGNFGYEQNSDLLIDSDYSLFLNNFESTENISNHYNIHLSEEITVSDIRNNQNNKHDVKNHSIILFENILISDSNQKNIVFFVPFNNFSFITTLERIFEREKSNLFQSKFVTFEYIF